MLQQGSRVPRKPAEGRPGRSLKYDASVCGAASSGQKMLDKEGSLLSPCNVRFGSISQAQHSKYSGDPMCFWNCDAGCMNSPWKAYALADRHGPEHMCHNLSKLVWWDSWCMVALDRPRNSEEFKELPLLRTKRTILIAPRSLKHRLKQQCAHAPSACPCSVFAQ